LLDKPPLIWGRNNKSPPQLRCRSSMEKGIIEKFNERLGEQNNPHFLGKDCKTFLMPKLKP